MNGRDASLFLVGTALILAGNPAAPATLPSARVPDIEAARPAAALISRAASGETPAARQVALVEMQGERIHRMRNFGAAPELLVATIHGKVQSELCARLSWNGERLAMNAVTVQPVRFPDSVSVSSP